MSLTLWPEADVDPALAITTEMDEVAELAAFQAARTDQMPTIAVLPDPHPRAVRHARRRPPHRRRALSPCLAAIGVLAAFTLPLLAEGGRLLLPTAAGLLP